jgi:tetratricopeptide (TPR) repeat protein
MRTTVLTYMLAGVFFAFMLSASILSAAETDDTEVASGIALVKKGDYKEGALILSKVIEKYPDNPEVNFYLGMALNRTSAGKEAESYLKRSLIENPDDPALNLELGMHYYNKDVHAEAADYFEHVIELDPKSELADRSREFLKKIEESGQEKSWSLNIFAGGQYDSNVILNGSGMPLPEGYSGKSDWSALVNLKAAYTPLKSETTEAGIAYSYYQNIHASLKKFDIMQNLAEVYGVHTITKDVSLKAVYSFEYLLLNGNDYDTAHSFAPSLIMKSDTLGTTIFDYRLRLTRYSNSDQFQTNSDRNGTNYLFGLTQILPISDTSAIWGLYSHDIEMTTKSAWDYDGNRLHLGGRCLLPLGLMSDISGEVYWKDYKSADPLFGQTRQDTLYSINVSVAKSFSARYSASLSEAVSKNMSNIPEFKYDRSITSIFFNAKF